MAPRPPTRAPHYVWDNDEPPTLGSAQALLFQLCSYARLSSQWLDRDGRTLGVDVLHESSQNALIRFTGVIEGRIELAIADSFWVRADLYRGEHWGGRGWIDCPFEECHIWPDGADGVVGPRVEDDPPGRISKRGAWIQFDTTQWPGFRSSARWIGFEIVQP